MKVQFVGDIHGRDTWKQIIDETADEIVFLGDYFDSFNIKPVIQQYNFKEILRLAEMRGNVTLLLGNHDVHYLLPFNTTVRGTGYNTVAMYTNKELLESAKKYTKFAWQKNNVLATHAGVCNLWANTYLQNVPIENIGEVLNDLWTREFGNNELFIQTGPLWVRWNKLKNDYLNNLTQIVGHTEYDDLQVFKNDETTLYNLDCVEYRDKIFTLEI